MFVTIYMVYVQPDNQYRAHSNCVCTLTLIPDMHRGNQITIELKVNKKETAHKRFIKDILRYSYQQDLLGIKVIIIKMLQVIK